MTILNSIQFGVYTVIQILCGDRGKNALSKDFCEFFIKVNQSEKFYFDITVTKNSLSILLFIHFTLVMQTIKKTVTEISLIEQVKVLTNLF